MASKTTHDEGSDDSQTRIPDPTREFLGLLFHQYDYVLVRPIETWTDAGKKKARTCYKETFHQRRKILAAPTRTWDMMQRMAACEHANLFFGVCPRFGGSGKFDLAWQIRTIRVLWADLDHCTPEEAVKRCKEAGLPEPSIVVCSGNGVHLYWLLVEPFVIDDADNPRPVEKEWVQRSGGGPEQKKLCCEYITLPDQRRLYQYLGDPTAPNYHKGRVLNPEWPELSPKGRHVQDVVAGIAGRIGADHTHDLARLLRLPGTLNRKDERNGRAPVPCEIVSCDPQHRYPFSEFEGFAAVSPARVKREKVQKIRLPQVRKLTLGRLDKLGDYINRCAVADDRSKADFALCAFAAEKGFDKEEVWSEVATVGKFGERGRPYFDLTWENAELKARERIYDREHRRITGGVGPSCNGSSNGNGVPFRAQHNGDGGGGPSSPGDSDDDSGGRSGGSGRDTVIITTDEHDVNDQVIAALPRAKALYQRAYRLVAVQRDTAATKLRAITRAPGTPRIAILPGPTIREILTRCVEFRQVNGMEDGEPKVEPAHPPDWCVAAVEARGQYPGVPHLESVIEAPTLRPDGTILDTPVWDEATGLLYEPNATYPPIPQAPSRGDAEAAAAILLDLVAEFPFVQDENDDGLRNPHQAVWLAALLTVLARFIFNGPSPLFAFDGSTPGVGKTKLVDMIAMIASGREISKTSLPDNDEEMRKRITAVAITGDRAILLDNIDRPLGGASLDAVLTATSWRDRILGESKMTAELPMTTVWFATGNNLILKGDSLRRVVPSRLESKEESPEERTGFKYPNLLEHVARERPRLVCAGVTILRAYFVAGCPRQKMTPFGSYEGWSDTIRSAVLWTIGADPCATRKGMKTADTKLSAMAALVSGWAELPGTKVNGVTVAEAIRILNDPQKEDEFMALRDALVEETKSGKVNPSSLGYRLRAAKGRIINGCCLTTAEVGARRGVQRWIVRGTPQEED
jgi:hypothetical protein